MVIKYSEHFVVVMQYLEVLQLKTTLTVCSSDNKKQILCNQMIFIDKKNPYTERFNMNKHYIMIFLTKIFIYNWLN